MKRPAEYDEVTLIRDASDRARALHDGLVRDRASVVGWTDWPEGPAVYDDALAAVERVIGELGAESAKPVAADELHPPPETPAP